MSLQQLLAKKRVQKAQFTKLKQKLSETLLEDSDFELLLNKLRKQETEFNVLFESIFTLCKEEDLDSYIKEQVEINENIDEIDFEINKKLFKVKNKAFKSEVNIHSESNVKLPKLSLPIFSGNLHEWLSFKDIFKASIHQNQNLSGAMKLQYLKSSLKGDAFRIIQSISIVDSNYELAWSLLEERYSNSREQVYAHLKRFLNIPSIQNESSLAILNLIDITSECVRSLEILEQNIEGFSTTMCAYILSQKLDTNTKLWWERHLKKDNLPTLNDLLEFLKDHARTLSASKVTMTAKRNSPKIASMISGVAEKYIRRCNACNQDSHNLYKCPKFLKYNVRDRVELVKKQKLCFNCLSQNHSVRNCNSTFACINCKKRHNSLLCYDRERNSISAVEIKSTPEVSAIEISAPNLPNSNNNSLNADATSFEISNNVNKTFAGTANVNHNVNTILLSTALVYIKTRDGNFIRGRTLIDSGSMSNFLTCQFAERLNLHQEKINVSVSCLTGATTTIKFKTTATISNISGDFNRELDFLIVPKITHLTPSNYVNIKEFRFPETVNFADPEFYKPGKIDLLLGAEVFLDLLRQGQIHVPNSKLVLQNTIFGHIVSGGIYNSGKPNKIHCGLVSDIENLTNDLRKFWEIEQIEEFEKFKSPEETECDMHFIKTHKRDESGRFVVQMPLKKDPSSLGDSKQLALNRLNSLWNRLNKEPELSTLYCQFMKEYETLGHMEEVVELDEPKIAYYLPHHAVFRPEKNSTKLRVVFNGSQVTSSGESLNSLQINGGVIQDDLFSIILRFRMHLYAFTADVKMMYRMILLDNCQRDLQRILWKSGVNEIVKTYRLCTVTYGTTSAPYLAMRCLQQLAKDGEEQFPSAATVVQSDFYMDDVLSGTSELDSAKKLQSELIDLLSTCKMQLHKWCSNHPALMETVVKPENYNFNQMNETKALGLLWKSAEDTFSFSLLHKEQSTVTKRGVLSTIARIFDPLGLLGPIVTKAKIFLQKLWLLQIDWDETLPQREADEWLQFHESLTAVNDINVQRHVLIRNPVRISLFGFADASEIAYGTSIYVVCVDSLNNFSSRLLCSKSRVAPIKTVTIPRLELCAAVLLTKLMIKVTSTLKIAREFTYFYSDSTIVLAWLQKSPSDLKTFVASRVATIQRLSDINHWRHVSSQDNPADLISRGVDPDKLLPNKLWWHGPLFLIKETENYSTDFELGQSDSDSYLREIKCPVGENIPKTTMLITECPEFINELLKLSNNYDKIIRIFCYILRFIHNSKTKEDRNKGPLTLSEIEDGEQKILKNAQLPLYSQNKKIISGNVCNLNPFVDEKGILRVGGRLEKASLSVDQKYPIILPKGCKLSEIVFYTNHKKLLHVGPQGLLNAVRLKFWPLGGRNLARKTVHSCVTCFKNKPILASQIMGNLPSERVNASPAFHCTGLDLCGPYLVSYKHQRKGTLNKIYICVCICFVTRAIHLEILSDLTSDALIAMLKRFFARRGKCAKIFTDNATNFVGANSELKKLYSLVNFPNDNLAAYLTSEGIDWNYIPPKSPHFGGLWEAGVKSVKHHLKRVMGKLRFNYEEFETIVIQIEGILNSRPLTPLSSDDDNFEVLTPGHFLIGRSINAIAEPQLIDKSDNRLGRWQKTTKVVQIVWKKWRNDYLNTLQQRSRWMIEKDNVKPGLMVLIKEDFLPCCKWLLGRIIKVYLGSDNKVRVVKVRTPTGELKRPIAKIAILPIDTCKI